LIGFAVRQQDGLTNLTLCSTVGWLIAWHCLSRKRVDHGASRCTDLASPMILLRGLMRRN
tara:strand:- start:21736 stop:21915 length:180 start_codon:yes stop_codon:yes gene_type:complete